MRWAGILKSCAFVIAIALPEVLADKMDNFAPVDVENPEVRIIEQYRIVESTVIVAHPKITEPPSLVKRKLGSVRWDMIHEGIQGQKRDAASCPTDYNLCPQSMKGGCCPSDRVCGTSSCYPTTAAPASACGKSGYIACGLDDGGGCCPEDYVCGQLGCTAPVGVSYSQTCGVNSYACPASLGYGCCMKGMGCGVSNCYSTAAVTYTITDTVTTTESGSVKTLTNIIVTSMTPVAPTGLGTSSMSGVVAKVTGPPQAAIEKTKATKATSDEDGGLTKLQLGGIVGGAVVLLVVLLVIAFVIIRRLRRAEAVALATSKTSSSGQRSRPTREPQTTRRDTATPDLDAMSIDPLIMAPSEMTESMRSVRHGSSQSYEVDAFTGPVFHSPFFPRSPPYNNHSGGYAPVAASDGSSSGYRNPSVDSTPGFTQSPAGYFDVLPARNDLRDQNLRFGHSPPTVFPPRRPSKHDRQWSQSSNQSHVSQTSSNMVELDAGPDGDRRSSLQRALQGLGMRLSMGRRRSSTTVPLRRASEPVMLTGGPAGRQSPAGLGRLDEAAESRANLQELGNGTLSPEMREILLREQARKDRARDDAYTILHDSAGSGLAGQGQGQGQGQELLDDVDLRH